MLHNVTLRARISKGHGCYHLEREANEEGQGAAWPALTWEEGQGATWPALTWEEGQGATWPALTWEQQAGQVTPQIGSNVGLGTCEPHKEARVATCSYASCNQAKRQQTLTLDASMRGCSGMLSGAGAMARGCVPALASRTPTWVRGIGHRAGHRPAAAGIGLRTRIFLRSAAGTALHGTSGCNIGKA